MGAVWDVASARRDGEVMPRIAIAALVSMLLHAALLMWAPRVPKPDMREPPSPPLTAYLKAPTQIKPPAKARPPRPEARATPPVPPPARPRAAPAPPPPAPAAKAPPIALEKPPPAAPEKPPPAFTVPAAPAPPPVADAPPVIKPVPPPLETDFMANIEARRRARGELSPEAAAAQQVENANKGALASAALAKATPSALIPDRGQNGYGTFEIRRRAFDYAEYMFKGWNENFRRDGMMLIEVRKGNASTIEIAVIRSMIEIIRRTESGDFVWRSNRLRQVVTLSARARDNAELEEFLMQEFLDDFRRYR